MFNNWLNSPFIAKLARLRAAMLLAASLLAFCALGQAQTSGWMHVFSLPFEPNPDQIAKAKTAFAEGAVVAMKDADPACFSSLFNVGVPFPSTSDEWAPQTSCMIAAR